jgi:hypothetical protein
MTMDFVPDLDLELSLTYKFLNASIEVLRLTERTGSLSGREELRLPLGRLRIAVSWDYGAPFSGNMRLAGGGQEVTVQLRNGRFESDIPFPFGNYSYRLIGGVGAVLGSGGFDHRGDVITITVRTVKISVSVKDLLGTPLPGAQVRVLKGGTLYGTGTTDRTGTATFTRLPEALVPYSVEVRVREHSERKLTSGGPLPLRDGRYPFASRDRCDRRSDGRRPRIPRNILDQARQEMNCPSHIARGATTRPSNSLHSAT